MDGVLPLLGFFADLDKSSAATSKKKKQKPSILV